MKAYKTTRQVLASPMTLGEYHQFRGWLPPADTQGNPEGYKIEYLKDGKNKENVSWANWLTKEAFERSYTEVINRPAFVVGDLVAKVGGDYRFDGVVVAAFEKLSFVKRYVVEDERGILHIYSDSNLIARTV